jgi:hypothetical protein
MRCTFCTLASGCRLLVRRVGGLPAMAAGVLLWFDRTASIVCLGWRWLRCVLLVLVPGIRLGGVGVCFVASSTCF